MQVHAASALGPSRPSLSPLPVRHLAFNSGGGRSERRPSLLGAHHLMRQTSGHQLPASPSSSQGFRKRNRFITLASSQPEPEPQAGTFTLRPTFAPARAPQGAPSALVRQQSQDRPVQHTGAYGTPGMPVRGQQALQSLMGSAVKHERPWAGATSAPAAQGPLPNRGQHAQASHADSSLPGHAVRMEDQVAEAATHHTSSAALPGRQAEVAPALDNKHAF